MQKRLFSSLILAIAAVCLAAHSVAAEDKVYGEGDGLTITESEVATFGDLMVPAHIVPTQEDLLRVILQQRLFELEAEKQGLDQDKKIQARLRLERQKILANAYAERYLDRELKITDEVVESYYLSHIEEFKQGRELHLYRLVVKDPAEAHALYEKALENPDTFPELAEAHSLDPQTQVKGGDMGQFREDRLKPEIRTALEGLQQGAIAGPIEIQNFFYIFWIKGVKPAITVSLDSVRDELYKKISAKKRQDLLRDHAASLQQQYNFKWEPWVVETNKSPQAPPAN